jgi:hypothetical protein
VRRQQVSVYTRLVIKAFRIGLRGQTYQIPVTLKVFGQEYQVEVGLLAGASSAAPVVATAARDVRLAAYDGLDALRLHGIIKRDGAVHIAVVRHRAGRHAELRDPLGQRLNLYRSIEETVVCVQVQVYEFFLVHVRSGLREVFE